MRVAIAACFLLLSGCATSSASEANENDVVRFLEHFGHLPPTNPNGPMAFRDIRAGILSYQSSMGLPQTGKLDATTVAEMKKPRCGNKDKFSNDTDTGKRRKRYALWSTKWSRTRLSYRFHNYTPDLSRSVVISEIEKAFQLWADASSLTFYEIFSGSADINIHFVAGRHNLIQGDSAFDGPSNVLAHAFLPEFGDAHFDEDETWTSNSFNGINLLQVGAHEIGHSLGLLHSNVRGALMYATYNGFQSDFRLHQDDINGIRALYGQNQGPPSPAPAPPAPAPPAPAPPAPAPPAPSPPAPSPPAPAPSPSNPRDVCSVTKFDAITTTAYGKTYFFVGNYFYEYFENNPTASRRTQLISDRWQYVSGTIDAAFTQGPYTVLFQTHSRLRYHGYHLFIGERRLDNIFRRTSRYLRNIPDSMNAAWVWGTYQKIYVSKDNLYWRYNGRNRRDDRTYPRVFNEWWPRAPQSIDAAFTDRFGVLHFVKGDGLYKFDNRLDRVVSVTSLKQTFFGCPSQLTGNEALELVNLGNRPERHEDPDAPEESDEADLLGTGEIDITDPENAIDLFTSAAPSISSNLMLALGSSLILFFLTF